MDAHLGQQLRKEAKERKSKRSSAGVGRYVLISPAQLMQIVDPVCLATTRTTSTGAVLTCRVICTQERPVRFRHATKSQRLSAAFWVHVTDMNGITPVNLA